MPDTKPHQKASGSGSRPGAADSADANNAPANNTETSSSTYQPPSKYRFIKDNWGNRINFQLSHGLRFDPDDFDEGNLILEGYLELMNDE
ncbi:hypothetical protein F5883DRAFT_641031 [Diaporthe sp. PMI_573]|nr:hypothetical protein F5883DRAFT_641031 [Diaporthaceae sp. PMI_573]